MSNYAIVRLGFDVPAEVYYEQTLEDAIYLRDGLIEATERDWRIFENIEDATKSKFWRWVARRVDARRERLRD